MSNTVRFNFNDKIRVKLKEEGYQILVDEHNRYCFLIPSWEERDINYYKSKADKDGYTEFQAWDFIEKFGEHTGMGKRLPYETTILISKEDLKE